MKLNYTFLDESTRILYYIVPPEDIDELNISFMLGIATQNPENITDIEVNQEETKGDGRELKERKKGQGS